MICGEVKAAVTPLSVASFSAMRARYLRVMKVRKRHPVPGIQNAMDSSWVRAPAFWFSKS